MSDSDSSSPSSSPSPKQPTPPSTTAPSAADDTATNVDTTVEVISTSSFPSLNVDPQLCAACTALGWSTATTIQAQSIPPALLGRDIIGLAETGSGKTGAFAIPVLQSLLADPQRLYAVVLAPTRELAFQIHEVFDALGQHVGSKSICITGGVDMMSQAIALSRKPHIIVATPGRLVDHLKNTKGFSLRNLKYLVMDEADECSRVRVC